MSPLIESGYIALVDRTQTNWPALVNRIVAVGDGEGLSLKWLRKLGKAYVLVPNNLNADNQMISVTPQHQVFGKVERWIGEPPPGRA